MKRGKVNKPVLHGWIETIHIVHIAILIWLDVWEITFHTFHTFQNMVYALWLVKIDNGSDVMNTTSHRVYQTREGGKRKGPRTTSDVWESGYPMWANRRQSWTLDSRNWISDSLSVEFGFQIPIVSGIPDSLSWVPGSKALVLNLQAKNFRIGDRKTVFPGFRNSTYLKWGLYCRNL